MNDRSFLSAAVTAVLAAAWLSAPVLPSLSAAGKGEEKPAAKGEAKPNECAVAAPKMMGDKIQARFQQKHEEFLAIAKKGGVDLLFLGDSITEAWSGPGKKEWLEKFAPLKAANFGIGGDRTQHVLWRITNGELDGITPKVVVLMIGTNNSGSNTAPHIAEGVTKIVTTIREKSKDTKVLLLAVFPRGQNPADAKVAAVRDKLKTVNETIAKLDDGKMVRYLDLGPKFLEKDGTLSKDVMPDSLHLSPKGYTIWAEGILPLVQEMMK